MLSFLPMMCCFCIYVLAVHWGCPEVANAGPGWCQGCQEMPSFFACDVLSFFAYMSWAMGCQIICLGSLLRPPRGCRCQCLVVPSIAKRCRVLLPVMLLSFFACDVPSFLHICPELPVAKLYVLAVCWGCPEVADAGAWWCQALPRDAEFFCLWCAEFFAYMSWATGCQIICLGSSLRLPRGCRCQCQVVPGIAKRCQVFCLWCAEFFAYMSWAMGCQIMSGQFPEAAQRLLILSSVLKSSCAATRPNQSLVATGLCCGLWVVWDALVAVLGQMGKIKDCSFWMIVWSPIY